METWNQPNAGGSRGWNRERDPKRVAKFIYGREEVLGALGQEKLLIRCLTYIPEIIPNSTGCGSPNIHPHWVLGFENGRVVLIVTSDVSAWFRDNGRQHSKVCPDSNSISLRFCRPKAKFNSIECTASVV